MTDKCDKTLSIDCKDYFDSKFDELEKRTALKDQLVERALLKAEQAMNYRLDTLNHITERISGFVTKSEYDIRQEGLQREIHWLTKTMYIGIGMLLLLQIVWKYIVVK